MRQRIWVFRDINRVQQMALAQALSISPVTASILLGRGVTTPHEANRWLSPSTSAEAHDPYLLPDMEKAVDRLQKALVTKEKVCFYGDYDVDGISATSLYLSYFQALGGQCRSYIPHRLREGYGLNEQALRNLRAEGVCLVVTSDCGTTSHREIAEANRLGLDVIVTDHHQSDSLMPSALAVINPHREDSAYPFRSLCSGSLAYKVVQAHQAKYQGCLDLECFLDLVALATVADVVPLQDENRRLVREGLTQISAGTRCGIRALKQVAGVTRTCTAETIAFRLAPRINAAGRLAHGLTGVQLLTTESESEARRLAEQLEQLNRDRQHIEEAITSEAMASFDSSDVPSAFVLGKRQWHLGVVGIVAARLVERFHRPAVVVGIDDEGIGKGSARTVPGFDLYQALSVCRDLLEGYGGHPSAAGLTIRESRLDIFRDRFTQLYTDWAGSRQQPTLHVDAEVQLQQIDHRLVRELETLHPFGAGNPEPMLVVRNLAIVDSRVVGEKHLKLTVRQGRSLPFESIGFRMGSLMDRGFLNKSPVDLAFVPEINHWNGYDRIQLRIRDVKSSQVI
ncbi:MAG: single-stranded-DNA-specific exonuclease RecJ [Nitrospiraceae bacterium]